MNHGLEFGLASSYLSTFADLCDVSQSYRALVGAVMVVLV